MEVDRQRFLEEGYVVLRQVVPPDQVEELRREYEILVDRQRAVWARDRAPGDPPGGHWETGAQPRLILSGMAGEIDASTAGAVEIWFHENVQGASSRLLGVEDAAVTEMMLMCSPVRDHGPARWHRDFAPAHSSSVMGYAEDIRENGPRYVQWNLTLYDDDVLWVVPGSHLRPNTPEEVEQLRRNDRAPLDSGVQTHLAAGDGVAYILPILHWASSYSTRLRRVIHGGFSNFTHYPEARCFSISRPGRGPPSSAGGGAATAPSTTWRPPSGPPSWATARATTGLSRHSTPAPAPWPSARARSSSASRPAASAT